MIKHGSKVLLLAAILAMAGMARADFSATSNATSDIATLHLQVTQTGAQLLSQSASKVTLSDLQSLVVLTQKYFSTRKEIEEPLFRQRLRDKRNFGYQDDYEGSYKPGQPYSPSVEQTLIAVFQHYLSANYANDSVSALTELRNILRPLQLMNEGHLSGGTWLYNSPLPSFAEQNLQPLDQQIIETSLADAAALRKKYQYASAIKMYKTLLTDYANTSHEAPIKVLLDAAIVEDYNYQAKLALGKHDYKTARAALKKIIALYPDSDYAKAAEKAVLSAVSAAVQYYQVQGDANFHPETKIGVPQSEAAIFYEKMYKEDDPDGAKADYALYYWARALGTEGKVEQEVKLLQQHLNDFPKSKIRAQAMYLLGFTYCNHLLRNYKEGVPILLQVVHDFPHSPEAPEALWAAASVLTWTKKYAQAISLLQQLKKNYPKSPRYKWVDDEIARCQAGL